MKVMLAEYTDVKIMGNYLQKREQRERFATTNENNAVEHARQEIVNPPEVIAAFGISAYVHC